jgi:hypothetical protein
MTTDDPILPTEKEPVDLYDKTLKRIRNLVVLLLGAGIVVHETLFTTSPQPVLLILAAGLLGLPLALGLDRKLQ